MSERGRFAKTLAFLDEDTLASKRWLEEITRSFNTNHSIVGVTGPTIPYEGSRLNELLDPVGDRLGSTIFAEARFPACSGI